MGNNSWMDSAFFWRHLVPQNVGNIIFGCYFLNIGLGPKQINGLAICSKNQFREYHAWNRIKKLMPQHCTHFLKLLKLYEKRSTCFQTLTFCRNMSFQKSWICPWISQGFPTPWIFGEAAGAADKKCGDVWGGREPPPTNL